ncbi:MAG TPA: hypothetical protein VEY51_04990 [Chondromyces sp.]|nr:hypothetical protein [Chondromyces sp.]
MKQLMNSVKKQYKSQEKLAVLRLELDYELAVLFEAMQEKNEGKITKCKKKLNDLRNELMELKAL